MAFKKISPEEVQALALAGEAMAFVDSRSAQAWMESNEKIPGAIRVPADEVEAHLNEIDPNSNVVVYCD